MKLIRKLPLLALVSLACVSCGQTNRDSSDNEVYETEEDKIYQKLWESKTIFNESCVMIEDETGKRSARLVYKPEQIVEVRDYTLQKVYDPSEYTVEGDRIVMTKSSTMPYLTKENIDCEVIPESIGGFYPSDKTESHKILFTEGVGIIMQQVMVTYKTNENWYGTVPTRKGERLPRLQKLLADQDPIRYVCNGDSIFTGANSSGVKGIEPFLDPFPLGFANEIERRYGSTVEYINTAKGGMMSDWGRQNVQANITQYDPNLVVIGYGMNDATLGMSIDTYIDNITFMVESIQSTCPNADIILCATIIANPNSSQYSYQDKLLEPLLELEDTYNNLAVLDMTTYSLDLLQRKNSLELYANNINHPCDFMVRGYVSNLMHLIEVEK